MMEFSVAAIEGALDRAGLRVETRGTLPDTASGITDDSRDVSSGSMFVAVRGSARDGHEFLEQAAARGAAVVVVEDATRTPLPAIVVRDGRRSAAVAAAAAYGEPAKSMSMIGVTGTNGKTTTVGILRHLLDGFGEKQSASIGTLGVLVGSSGRSLPGGADLTTPGPVELQRVLRSLTQEGVGTVAMEVSSHSLDQRRVEGLSFEAAVFTNLTRDHLDYHGTEEAYFEAKARLLDQIPQKGAAVVNADEPAWERLQTLVRRISFGESPVATVRASDVRFRARGSAWTLMIGGEAYSVELPLIGAFNISNALGATAAACHVGLHPRQVAGLLGTVPQVPGRLEILSEYPTVLRDYAHTPDALERSLMAVRPFTEGRLIVVFGCGGDRDRGKRPLMGRVASRNADMTILTSDNPRTEDPEGILDEVEVGLNGAPHHRVEDRRSAIELALQVAQPNDVVVLAGKGHETYQIRGKTRFPFDEKLIVRELIGEGSGEGRAGGGMAR
ncbi:MAG: UDP-N-acetylmuramoyl-L-alanyl-D-glutamate--2,6-diaminopimelate ligase [Gemmatimonadaceae bacterium]